MKNHPKPSAAKFAYETMKEWIVSGFLVPGEKVDQDDCARKLNLSRMPIRSALDRLASEGLVIKKPHRGVIVSPLSNVLLNEVFEARAQIESMSAMLAVTKATDETVAKLYHLLDYQSDLFEDSSATILSQNRSFHRYITQLSENETLLRIFDNLWEQSERYRRIYYKNPDSNKRILEEHRRIVDLIAARKAQEVGDYMAEHTRKSQRALLELLGKSLEPTLFRVVYLPKTGADAAEQK